MANLKRGKYEKMSGTEIKIVRVKIGRNKAGYKARALEKIFLPTSEIFLVVPAYKYINNPSNI